MSNEAYKANDTVLRNALRKVTDSILDALDAPFFPQFGSLYDRIVMLLSANPETIAKILELRPDLQERKLSSCILYSEQAMKTLSDASICRTTPHASNREEYIAELAYFIERINNDKISLKNDFVPEAFYRVYDDNFSKEYSNYEKYLTSDVHDYYLVPLPRFRAITNVEFSGNAVIRKISQEEFHNLAETEETHKGILASYPEYILSIPVNGRSFPSIEHIVTSLRLLKKESIGVPYIYGVPAFPFKPWKVFNSLEGLNATLEDGYSLFTIELPEVNELIKINQLLVQHEFTGYLDVAIRRFNIAYGRTRKTDAWIDLFVALESLYSTGSETSEIAHRLATRLSHVIGNSIDERKTVRAQIKNWYTLRSKIVHGQKADFTPTDLKDLQHTVRLSLLWFLKQSTSLNHDEIIDFLDLGTF